MAGAAGAGSVELKLEFSPIRIHMGHAHRQGLPGTGITALGDTHKIHRQIGNVNQGPAATVLLNYMATQMAADLDRYVQPRG